MKNLILVLITLVSLSGGFSAKAAEKKFAVCFRTLCTLPIQTWRAGYPVVSVLLTGAWDADHPAYQHYVASFRASPNDLSGVLEAANASMVKSCVRGVLLFEADFDWEKIPWCKPLGL